MIMSNSPEQSMRGSITLLGWAGPQHLECEMIT